MSPQSCYRTAPSSQMSWPCTPFGSLGAGPTRRRALPKWSRSRGSYLGLGRERAAFLTGSFRGHKRNSRSLNLFLNYK